MHRRQQALRERCGDQARDAEEVGWAVAEEALEELHAGGDDERRSPILGGETSPAQPFSLLNDYLHCPCRAALKIVEDWREANVHTERCDIVHEHSDLAGYEVVKSSTLGMAPAPPTCAKSSFVPASGGLVSALLLKAV